jgi:acyl-coenzyme A thioesterase PaaI-like protein
MDPHGTWQVPPSGAAGDPPVGAGPRTGGSTDLSIQERLYPQLTCFGCGHANPKGLKLRSFPEGDVVVAQFVPWPEHDNGFGFLNGGIIATVLDCHSGAAVYHGVSVGSVPVPAGEAPLYVTAGLEIRFLRPAPLGGELQLRAELAAADPDLVVASAELSWDGRARAVATSEWRRWKPR